MKSKIKSLTMALLATVTLASTALVSCEKDNDPQQTDTPNAVSLAGTNWQNQVENGTVNDWQGIPHSYTEQTFIHFTSESEGTIEDSFNVPDLPEESYDDVVPFVYTFDGSEGTLTATDQGITQTLTFVITGDKLILTLDENYYSLIFTRMP